MGQYDQGLLTDISLTVASHLSSEGPGSGIHPVEKLDKRSLEVEKEETDGWRSIVGRIRLPGTQNIFLQIWLDRWTGGKSRRFYCGFAGSNPAVQKVVDSAPERFRPRQTFTARDTDGTDYARLKHGLPATLFGCPVHERLPFGGFHGLYFREPLSNIAARSSFIRESVTFFVECSSAARKSELEKDFPTVTERRLVRLHTNEEFARNGMLAKRRKQKDSYTCKVCLTRLEDRYGSLGQEYAEAHHIVPLHLLPKYTNSKTSIDDLITVCPNCHRMLHRMDGLAEDWVTLQENLLPSLM